MYEYDFFVAGRWQNKDNIIPIVQSVRAAYGMGKKCYAVGIPEKTETLYCIFEKIDILMILMKIEGLII